MRKRLSGVAMVLVVLAVMVAPGAALAAPAERGAAAPDAPLVLDWFQRNASGFGTKDNAAVSALEFFGGQLYAGTTNDLGAQLWRTSDGDTWSLIPWPSTFSSYGHGVLFDMIVFNGQLYAGNGAWPVLGTTGEIWRTADGTKWERMAGAWEKNSNNAGVTNFATFGGGLYITTYNPNEGIEVYRSFSGNSDDWTRVASASFGLKTAYPIATGLTAFKDALYVALEGYAGGPGMRVLRTFDGVTWVTANLPGFGNTDNYGAGGFAVHNGYLYVGTRNDVTGGQIWRTADGANWEQVGTSGFGSPLNYKIEGLVSAQGTLFAFSRNDATGTQVWSSVTGTSWQPSNTPGFGSVHNKAVALWSNGSGALANQLFLGTFNQEVGGQVWSTTPPVVAPLDKKIFLPLIARGQ